MVHFYHPVNQLSSWITVDVACFLTVIADWWLLSVPHVSENRKEVFRHALVVNTNRAGQALIWNTIILLVLYCLGIYEHWCLFYLNDTKWVYSLFFFTNLLGLISNRSRINVWYVSTKESIVFDDHVIFVGKFII